MISNQGPSTATEPKVYILLPKNELWLPTADLVPPRLQGTNCTATTMTKDLKSALGSLSEGGAASEADVSLSCQKDPDNGCQVFEVS